MRSDQQANEEIDKDSTKVPAVSNNFTQVDLLFNTVETELIPRLFNNHMTDVPGASRILLNKAAAPSSGPWASADNIQRFARLCLADQPSAIQAYITDLLTQGISLESVYLYLLTPAANFLGNSWSNDQLSFAEVQLGMCCLQQLVFDCEAIGFSAPREVTNNRSILVASTPGEDHTFGISMLADFFRRYGWFVQNASGLSSIQVAERVKINHFTMVGFSLHSVDHYQSLQELISIVREKSINPDITIMVGGHYFNSNPDKVLAVGADESAANGYDAVMLASKTHQPGEVGV